MKELEKRMTKYQEAALFLGEQCVLPSSMHIVAVTQPLDSMKIGSDDAEVLLTKDAPWGSTIPAPDSWGPKVHPYPYKRLQQKGEVCCISRLSMTDLSHYGHRLSDCRLADCLAWMQCCQAQVFRVSNCSARQNEWPVPKGVERVC